MFIILFIGIFHNIITPLATGITLLYHNYCTICAFRIGTTTLNRNTLLYCTIYYSLSLFSLSLLSSLSLFSLPSLLNLSLSLVRHIPYITLGALVLAVMQWGGQNIISMYCLSRVVKCFWHPTDNVHLNLCFRFPSISVFRVFRNMSLQMSAFRSAFF